MRKQLIKNQTVAVRKEWNHYCYQEDSQTANAHKRRSNGELERCLLVRLATGSLPEGPRRCDLQHSGSPANLPASPGVLTYASSLIPTAVNQQRNGRTLRTLGSSVFFDWAWKTLRQPIPPQRPAQGSGPSLPT